MATPVRFFVGVAPYAVSDVTGFSTHEHAYQAYRSALLDRGPGNAKVLTLEGCTAADAAAVMRLQTRPGAGERPLVDWPGDAA